MNEPRLAYGYVRVSTEEQVEGMSLRNQRLAIQKYADTNGFEIVGWFSDEGISAKTAKRPALQNLITQARKDKGRVSATIVYNLSRLSRNMESFAKDIGFHLSAQGNEVLSTQEPLDSTPTGKFMKNIFLAIHQLDNDYKAATTQDNMKLVAQEGWWQAKTLLGYKIIKVTIGIHKNGKPKQRSALTPNTDGGLSDKVASVLRRYSQGDISQVELINYASSIGLYAANGKPFHLQSMKNMLTNIAYTGNLQSPLTDNQIVKAKHDGLIDLATFQVNQRLLQGKKKVLTHQPNELYPLKSAVLCIHCEKFLTGSAPRTGSGAKSPRYHCPRCNGFGSISPDKAHDLFADFLSDVTPTQGTVKLFKTVVRRTAGKKLVSVNAQLSQLRDKQSKLDEDIQKALQKFLDDEITKEEKDVYQGNLRIKRLALEEEMDTLEGIQRLNEATIEYVCNFIDMPAKMWSDADFEARMEFQKLLMPTGIVFDIKAQTFGTKGLSPLYRLNLNKKDLSSTEKSLMVTPAGVEPAIFRMRT